MPRPNLVVIEGAGPPPSEDGALETPQQSRTHLALVPSLPADTDVPVVPPWPIDMDRPVTPSLRADTDEQWSHEDYYTPDQLDIRRDTITAMCDWRHPATDKAKDKQARTRESARLDLLALLPLVSVSPVSAEQERAAENTPLDPFDAQLLGMVYRSLRAERDSELATLAMNAISDPYVREKAKTVIDPPPVRPRVGFMGLLKDMFTKGITENVL